MTESIKIRAEINEIETKKIQYKKKSMKLQTETTNCIPQGLCSDLNGKELQKKVDICIHIYLIHLLYSRN